MCQYTKRFNVSPNSFINPMFNVVWRMAWLVSMDVHAGMRTIFYTYWFLGAHCSWVALQPSRCREITLYHTQSSSYQWSKSNSHSTLTPVHFLVCVILDSAYFFWRGGGGGVGVWVHFYKFGRPEARVCFRSGCTTGMKTPGCAWIRNRKSLCIISFSIAMV